MVGGNKQLRLCCATTRHYMRASAACSHCPPNRAPTLPCGRRAWTRASRAPCCRRSIGATLSAKSPAAGRRSGGAASACSAGHSQAGPWLSCSRLGRLPARAPWQPPVCAWDWRRWAARRAAGPGRGAGLQCLLAFCAACCHACLPLQPTSLTRRPRPLAPLPCAGLPDPRSAHCASSVGAPGRARPCRQPDHERHVSWVSGRHAGAAHSGGLTRPPSTAARRGRAGPSLAGAVAPDAAQRAAPGRRRLHAAAWRRRRRRRHERQGAREAGPAGGHTLARDPHPSSG